MQLLASYRFILKYRPGKDNVLADVLSRKDLAISQEPEQYVLLPPERWESSSQTSLEPSQTFPEPFSSSVSAMTGEIVNRIKTSNRTYDSLQGYQDQVGKLEQWTVDNGLLLHNGKLVVPDDRDLRARLLDEIHRLPLTAHPGEDKLTQLFRTRYYWPGWTADIHRYIDNCQVCKRTKNQQDRAPGLLQPLPIPTRPWQHISIDFCSLPKDKYGFDNVIVIVDRFSKRTISISCHKTITAAQAARLFVDHTLRWAGCPESIVSDRGPQFISEF